MKKFAVIGKDVSKSLSPQIHSFIARQTGAELTYEKLSIPEESFEERIGGLLNEYDGLNVTIPYKLRILPHLKSIEGDAKVFGAVNTVRTRDLSGHNTDGAGFALMLKLGGVNVGGSDALVIGAGGAGRSVVKKLADAGARVYVYDKIYENALRLQTEFDGVTALCGIENKPYFTIVNASGVGMHKTEGVSPVKKELLSMCGVAVDLIYTPAKSEFLRIAENCGKRIINGGAMLFYQAYLAQCIFLGKPADGAEADSLFKKYTEEIL